jgi:hypothetical protein
MSARINAHHVDLMTDGHWSFRDAPSVVTYAPRGYGSGTFDPFPAYPHRAGDVEDAARAVAQAFPPLWDIDLYSMNREEIGRSNGYSNLRETGHWDENGEYVKDPVTGVIVLSGKRIPPHPAVTRYLVAHEYGHNVEYMLNRPLGGAESNNDDTLLHQYAELRGLPPESVHQGSGGRWHNAAAEIFACDFRILVCGIEVEYWPHPDVQQPTSIRGLSEWWAKATAFAHEQAAQAVAS